MQEGWCCRILHVSVGKFCLTFSKSQPAHIFKNKRGGALVIATATEGILDAGVPFYGSKSKLIYLNDLCKQKKNRKIKFLI